MIDRGINMNLQQQFGAASLIAPKSSRARPSPAGRVQAASEKEVTLLDYGAGNVRSVRNACHKLGYTLREVYFQY